MSAQPARMTIDEALAIANLVAPPPVPAGEALRLMRDTAQALAEALCRVRDAAGLPANMHLLDLDQGVAELRRQAEGKS